MAARKNENGLTDKEEAFKQAFIETDNACKAYRRSYKADKMSDTAIRVEAHRVLHRPNVSLAIKEAREKHAKRHDVTIDTVTAMLKDDRDLARGLEQSSAAVSAAMGLAKLHGLIIDKSNVTVTTHEEKLKQLEGAVIAATSEDDEEHPTVQ